jgi:hypothetical protein
MTSKQRGPVLPFCKSRKCISCRSSVVAYLEPRVPPFYPIIRSTQEIKIITNNKLHTRTKLQWFLNKAPCSSFKKLIISMLSLLQGVHTMSLGKLVPDKLHPQECKHTKLCEPPPVPYVPVKDEVQEKSCKNEKPPNQDFFA